ncbi:MULTISPECIES: MerR family transcriptional regulator [Terrisporobacter]|uniref:Transcriptional regulator n=2 Tax=Terrisporobacter TaxID=1505652 RepID=A0A0B3VM87_9FIRM|nr:MULTISPECIES: MerR family transcriptional regulator [Terrisporobacter]KHS57901.1 transcriptional regulator [Terrisporobacter othiniensis]MCR1823191.1 MerR family transcriptional regulator [Terrisporobacter muris]MDU6984042.1 MerR family transcriptional regulator [Terrisporobacter othiniensis]MDY3373827.1 MerR family transcriptional regulator [Terrisporobacter othiniensis]
MQINEVIQQVDLTKRAIKYYEEQGLLSVNKDENGYRNYTKEDVALLKEISVYRKLGISIKDIKILLEKKDYQLLNNIYKEKINKLEECRNEAESLKRFIDNNDVDEIYENLDYETLGKAIQDMIPGFYGYYFMNHFMPYLQIKIETKEQEDAYKRIIEFWDNADVKIPLLMKLNSFIMYKLLPKQEMSKMVEKMDAKTKELINISEEEYEKLKEQTRKGVKMKNSIFLKYHPAFILQRKFMKRLQDSGYNDIFIPNMILLSPKYKEYHEALTKVNNRICNDLGLHYDSKYNLLMKV